MTTTNVTHLNSMLSQLKEQHKNHVDALKEKIKELEYQIKLLEDFTNRLDDL
jgi:polyhydroxyalkanoate synthesis regulator phasin